MRTGRADRLAYRCAFVTAEVIHHHHVTWPERRDQHALDISAEDVAVDRPVEHPGRVDPVMAQSGNKGGGVPVPERGHAGKPRALRRPAPERGHVGLHPGLVDEDQPCRIDPPLMALPPLPATLHVWPFTLIRNQRLFLNVSPQARRNRQTVSWLTETPRSARRACKAFTVSSGQASTRARSQSRCGSRTGLRCPPIFPGLIEPVCATRLIHFTAVEGATPNRKAAALRLSPASTAATTRDRRSSE